jgi:hypothetical protein
MKTPWGFMMLGLIASIAACENPADDGSAAGVDVGKADCDSPFNTPLEYSLVGGRIGVTLNPECATVGESIALLRDSLEIGSQPVTASWAVDFAVPDDIPDGEQLLIQVAPDGPRVSLRLWRASVPGLTQLIHVLLHQDSDRHLFTSFGAERLLRGTRTIDSGSGQPTLYSESKGVPLKQQAIEEVAVGGPARSSDQLAQVTSWFEIEGPFDSTGPVAPNDLVSVGFTEQGTYHRTSPCYRVTTQPDLVVTDCPTAPGTSAGGEI